MKRLLILPLMLATALAVIPAKPLRLLWDYPTDSLNTNLIFLLYSSTNVATPRPWELTAMVYATNWYSNGVWTAARVGDNSVFEVTQAVQPGERYFYLTASNQFWEAESLPSNTLALDPLPSQGGKLRALKGW